MNRGIPNIRYIGHKPHGELPAYLLHSTACIVPFRINPITIATNPIKVYEYLASGKPVVSTDLPEVRRIPGVRIGGTHEEFLEKLDDIFTGRWEFPRETVKEWMKGQTWEQRFKSIEAMLGRFGISPTE